MRIVHYCGRNRIGFAYVVDDGRVGLGAVMSGPDRWVIHSPDIIGPLTPPARPVAQHSGQDSAQDPAQVDTQEQAPVITAVTWCWVGAHGGAGTSCLQQVSGIGLDCGTTWPTRTGSSRVLLVGRTNAHGLKAVRRILAGRGPGAAWAVVLVADAPGRLPRPLREQIRVLGGTAPRLVRIGWEPSWRLGEITPSSATAAALRELLGSASSDRTGVGAADNESVKGVTG